MRFMLLTTFLTISLLSLYVSSLYAKDSSKNTSKSLPKEQIARQNILTLFRWIESGDLEKRELNKAVAVIRKQLKILKKECLLQKKPCPAAYGYLDNSFFKALAKGYQFEGNNQPLLNRLFVEAAKGKEDTAVARHPWLDIKNNLLDCLENEVGLCCGTSKEAASADLLKPEIFVAPDVYAVVSIAEGGLDSIISAQFNLSDTYRLVHKGSTARGTSLDNTDFDFDLLFKNEKDLDRFLGRLSVVLRAFTRQWRKEGYRILSIHERNILPKKMINFIIQDKNGIVFMLQIFVGKNIVIYADRLNDQIEQIKALGGNWDELRWQIILLKKLVRGVLHSYRKSLGGLDGMECEQLIIQAGSSLEYGRKITSIGSFDKAMRWIHRIGFDQGSLKITPYERIASQFGIYYTNTQKYIPLALTDLFWGKLVNAAKRYVEINKVKMSEDEFASLGK